MPEQETLAILEALLKWEDKLISYPITMVTNHKSLEYLKTQSKLSSRQTQWLEFLQQFNITVKHIDGSKNKVADALSHYNEYDTWEDKCPPEDHIDVDIHLDPNHDELSWERICEVKDYKESLTAITIPTKPASIQDNEPTQVDNSELDPSIHESCTRGENLRKQMNQNDSFTKSIRDRYPCILKYYPSLSVILHLGCTTSYYGLVT
jgi:hypothetical protein